MKQHLRAASLLFNQPLLITPDMLDLAVRWANQTMSLNIVNLSLSGSGVDPGPKLGFYDDDDGPSPAQRLEEQRRAAIAQTGVEVIPVHGFLVSRANHLDVCETMTSYEGLRASIKQAIADPMVERIVLDIDSPGGSAVGCFELAADIRAASLIKPISGLVNFSAYSAAYFIASACTEVVVSQTSGVGSIGVIASHMDRSRMLEGAGVKVTTVYAGAHKNDLNPNEPLTEQSLAVLNTIVQENYQLFAGAVAQYRNLDLAKVIATEAACYWGQSAVDVGLADRLESPQMAVDGISRAVALSRAQRQSVTQARQRIAVQAAAFAIQAEA